MGLLGGSFRANPAAFEHGAKASSLDCVPENAKRRPRDGAGLYGNLLYRIAHFVLDLIVHFPHDGLHERLFSGGSARDK